MNNMTVSFAPHIHSKNKTSRIMLDVVIALCPVLIASVVIFGTRAAVVTGVCVTACVFWEWSYDKVLKKPNTINDLSAVITGMLLAFNLPVGIPLWQAVFGCAVAIILVKQLFGGLGKNFANPAITARIVMFLAFSTSMTTWVDLTDAITAATPWEQMPDAITGATPLMLISRGEIDSLPPPINMFLGLHGGCLGETCVPAILIGGLYLLFRRVITWHTPVAFTTTVFVLTSLFGPAPPLYHLFGGGLFLGAFFMATDYPTTPQTNSGRLVFGLGCGVLTVVIRLFGNYPEGVAFAILFMNMLVPYINRFTFTKPLGGVNV